MVWRSVIKVPKLPPGYSFVCGGNFDKFCAFCSDADTQLLFYKKYLVHIDYFDKLSWKNNSEYGISRIEHKSEYGVYYTFIRSSGYEYPDDIAQILKEITDSESIKNKILRGEVSGFLK
jgi:basic membrane lipoprotein Med (substrate-binding protein (PBP1-ABC) superfamily)